MTGPLWQPSEERIAATNLTAFMQHLRAERGLDFTDYDDLYDWSIDDIEGFWTAVWDFCGVIADPERGPVVVNPGKMPGATFFPEARLNFAENLLRRRDSADALVFWGEDKVKRRLSFKALYDSVSRVAQALAAEGVELEKATVQLPARKLNYSIILRSLLGQARLVFEVRTAEAGQPSLWITTFRSQQRS